MFEKFELQAWTSLRDEDTISDSDVVEDMASGKRELVGKSSYYGFLRGHKACEARKLPTVYDIVRRA